MLRYLLDTCVVIWFLEENPRIKDLIEDITYFQGDYGISIESLKEYLYLTQSGKLKTNVTYPMLLNTLRENGISIYPIEDGTLETLYKLPFFANHPDPSDRIIIAQSIYDNRTLISGDHNFMLYKDLKLLSV